MPNDPLQQTTVWLITFNDWYCPRDEPHGQCTKHQSRERVEAMSSRKPLNDALAELVLYQRAYHERYPMSAITLRVTHIAALPGDTDQDILAENGVHNLDLMVEACRND